MEINGEVNKKLRQFARLLLEANARARVVGPADEETIYEEHVRDALAALPWLEKFPPGSSFADVGTGGGLPGIAWGICRPDLRWVLVDSVGKKIGIVREIASRLGLENITAVHARSEDLARSNRERFDAATARGLRFADSGRILIPSGESWRQDNSFQGIARLGRDGHPAGRLEKSRACCAVA